MTDLPSSLSAAATRADLSRLVAAINAATFEDSMHNMLSPEQWEVLASYLQPVQLASGQVLFAQGSLDRTLYLVESGSLSIHYEDAKKRLRLAIVGPGALVGEGGFSRTARAAPRCRPGRVAAVEPVGPAPRRAGQPTAGDCPAAGHGRRLGAGQAPGRQKASRGRDVNCARG